MKSISQQTRSLIQKQQELGLIDSRISQLKQQLQLQESNNHIIEFKVNKILETKKNTSKDQSDVLSYNRRLENINQEQQNRNSKYKLLKHLQQEDSFRKKRELDEEKRLDQEVMKEQSILYQLQYKHKQNEELLLKKQQFQKIQEQKFNIKQKLDLKRIEIIENVRNCQIKKKADLSVKFDLQQQEYQLKIQEEQQLLKKISFSQLKFQALKDDLDLAQKISIKDYINSTTNQDFLKQTFNQSNIKKVIMTNPYAQIPSILNQKDVDKLNLLSKLLKPSFKDQQQTTERLNKKNNQTHFNTQFSDRTHTNENSSKFDTETSQTKKNKFQSKKDQNAQTKAQHYFNENLDTQKFEKSQIQSFPQENENEEEGNKENQQNYYYEEEVSNENTYKDDNYEDDNQPLQQNQDEQQDQYQEQLNEQEFQDEEQYPADDEEQ